MKLLVPKKIVAAEGADVVKSFTVPASARRSGGLGLGQGLLINEIFTAAASEIERLARNHDYTAVIPENRQILFFAHTLPGDLVHVHVKAVRRTRNIKITVELRKDVTANDLVATGKFVYGVK